MNAILRFLTGGFIDKLFGTVERVYDRKLTAETDAKRMAADLAVKQMEGMQQARLNAKEIRIATAGFFEMRLITFLIAAPFVAHLWLVALDTMLTNVYWGIPALPKPFDEWEAYILLSFFGVQIASKVTDTFAAILLRKK